MQENSNDKLITNRNILLQQGIKVTDWILNKDIGDIFSKNGNQNDIEDIKIMKEFNVTDKEMPKLLDKKMKNNKLNSTVKNSTGFNSNFNKMSSTIKTNKSFVLPNI